jgi:hypothetical protein
MPRPRVTLETFEARHSEALALGRLEAACSYRLKGRRAAERLGVPCPEWAKVFEQVERAARSAAGLRRHFRERPSRARAKPPAERREPERKAKAERHEPKPARKYRARPPARSGPAAEVPPELSAWRALGGADRVVRMTAGGVELIDFAAGATARFADVASAIEAVASGAIEWQARKVA